MTSRRVSPRLGWLALIALCGLSPAPLYSAPPAIELVAQHLEATNLHLAGGEGAINFRRKIRLRFSLYPDRSLRGEEIGERRENNLYRERTTQDEAEWRQAYSGHYSYDGPTLRLELERGERRCTHRKTENSQPPGQTLPCAPVSSRLRLECASQTLTLDDVEANQPAGSRTQDAWRCTLAAGAQIGDSALPWIFGKGTCIETTPRFHGAPAVYRRCRP